MVSVKITAHLSCLVKQIPDMIRIRIWLLKFQHHLIIFMFISFLQLAKFSKKCAKIDNSLMFLCLELKVLFILEVIFLRVFKAFGWHHFLEIQGFFGFFIFLGKTHWVPLRLTQLFLVRLVSLKLPSLKNLLDCFQPLKRFWIWLEVILHLGGVLAAQAYQSPRRRFASL